MNIGKIQAMDMHIDRVVKYSIYVDCLVRIIRELKESGIEDDICPSDIPNLLCLLNKYAQRLRHCVFNMSRDWEFYEKIHKIS